jgi:uncharacterized protein
MSRRSEPFQLLIKPTSWDCNLRCEYCFYLKTQEVYPERGRHLMTQETLEKMIKGYLQMGFPVPVFIWQGGEPSLCGLDFFRAAIELEKKYGRPGQMIGNAFQTNGMLIDEEWAEFFSRNQFLVGLSFDGPSPIHNRFRKDLAGKGSFDRAWDAARMLRTHGVEFNILSMITRENQGRAAEIYRFFKDSGFNYLQFIPALELDPATGNLADFSPNPEGMAEFLVELFELWWPDRERVSIRDFEWLLAPNFQGRLCIFSEHCAPYLAVEHNGDIFPCDFFVRTKDKVGNLALDKPGLEELFRKRERVFSPQKKWLSRSCRECNWLRFCHGGCLREREPKNNPDPKKSIYCKAYASLFERAWSKLKTG